jgi:hypothetical protein
MSGKIYVFDVLYNLRNSARFQPPKYLKSHFRDSRFQNFPGGACPRTPLGGLAPSAFASPPQKLRSGYATDGKVTISRGPAESCKMNKCCFEPASLKKAVLFVQRWCGQQTLSLKNASFHVLRVAILIHKFHTFFIACLYSRF